jgi:hypothetical protein
MADRRYWRIAIGSEWFPLDHVAVSYVHYLWCRNQSGLIQSSFFRNGPVYVDFDNGMAIIYNDVAYTIAYC